MKQAITFMVLITLISCVSAVRKTNTYVLKYQDFGPPVIANRLIGMDWWQWQEHGDSRPTDYDIRVVVYRNLDLQDVKKKYTVIPLKKKDYRYIEYREALRYLDHHIKENVMEGLTSELKNTKIKILNSLGDK